MKQTARYFHGGIPHDQELRKELSQAGATITGQDDLWIYVEWAEYGLQRAFEQNRYKDHSQASAKREQQQKGNQS